MMWEEVLIYTDYSTHCTTVTNWTQHLGFYYVGKHSAMASATEQSEAQITRLFSYKNTLFIYVF